MPIAANDSLMSYDPNRLPTMAPFDITFLPSSVPCGATDVTIQPWVVFSSVLVVAWLCGGMFVVGWDEPVAKGKVRSENNE